ncbi:hypothetical protein Moror_2397 [Moniliophthora roreri MCA 2997]|uniref:F-box domain-containing protein n=2 Tax=Moniliophthora roreri TaxID=221103 RepID=V2WW56_MONRO|nr:hypothetical protein Moror_2397 [Moniliophthora roreri MCA 2997]
MQLLDLPIEILCSLPLYLRNIEDFTEASTTCRTLYRAFSTASPNTILRLTAASSPTFFSSHLLVAATARQVSDWALQSPSNTKALQKAFQGGIDGLLDFCVEKVGLSLEDIRRLHLVRFSLITSFSDKIDKMAGDQWYQTPDFWDGGVSEPWTILTDSDRAAYQIIIYGELFSSSMQAYLEPEKNLPRFELGVRLDYIKYCVPDWFCKGGYPGLEVLAVGPYSPQAEERLPEDQKVLRHILTCSRWRRLWQTVMHSIGPDFEVDWKQNLWFHAVQYQGLGGLEMLADEGVPDEWRTRLRKMYDQVSNLKETDKPGQTEIGKRQKRRVSHAPDFGEEVVVCRW